LIAHKSFAGATGLLLFVWSASVAPAATITFTNTQIGQNGTGFGNVANLLVVHATGQQQAEYGSVLWNGTQTVLHAGPGAGGNATNQSETQTAATVAGLAGLNNGFFEFGLVFNANEPGSDPNVVLHDFTLRFQDATGGTLFDATYTAPPAGLTLQDFGGTGQAGWLFLVRIDPNNATEMSFLANPNNQLGMFITPGNSIGGFGGGPESFHTARTNNGPPPGGNVNDPVPEPATIAVFGLMAGCAALGARLRRKAPAVRLT
jgi:hypothetical protein